jgi:hypothetical protein
MTQTSINPITPVNRDELVRLSEKGKSNLDSNRYLPDRPELLENELSRLKAEAARLTPIRPGRSCLTSFSTLLQ